MNMRILFCDDDSQISALLYKNVKDYFKRNGLKQPDYAIYTSGDELLKHETKADIVFLDIEMPGKSGIHIGAKLMDYNPRVKIIIVTSFQDYLDEAMKVRVFRFLSKPINLNRLISALKDALYQYSMETVTIPIETKDGVIVCNAEDIICFEGTRRETKIYTVEGEIESTKGIQFWQDVLDVMSFYSTYRNFIVNMKYVASFDKQTVKLKNKSIEVSAYLARRRYVDFKNQYLLYMESKR